MPDGGTGGSEGLKFTHCEFHTNAMLSVIASLTPYSDYNQSPRNMYQCQMAKQTMGTPVQVQLSQRLPVSGICESNVWHLLVPDGQADGW